MEDKKEIYGTSDMPVPPVVDYNVMYKIQPVFRKDLITVIGNLAYCEVKKIKDILDSNNDILSTAQLNDFITTLSNLPYRVINPLMKVIENTENFNKYFSPINVKKQQ
jgi:hypothetical protein